MELSKEERAEFAVYLACQARQNLWSLDVEGREVYRLENMKAACATLARAIELMEAE